MTRAALRRVGLVALLLVVLFGATAGRTVAFHFLPFRWTGEAERLASVLALRPGAVVADIGAGDGEMALAIAEAVMPSGKVYATEITEKQRAVITEAARDANVAGIEVVAARERSTGLPDACCDAIYMRNVLHHIADREAYAKELRRAVKPGGRIAILDFGPGTFFHLAGSHGVTSEQVVATLRSAGFRVDHLDEEWGGGLFLVLAHR